MSRFDLTNHSYYECPVLVTTFLEQHYELQQSTKTHKCFLRCITEIPLVGKKGNGLHVIRSCVPYCAYLAYLYVQRDHCLPNVTLLTL